MKLITTSVPIILIKDYKYDLNDWKNILLENYNQQGHHQLSGKSNENKSFEPNQIAPSVYMMIDLCYFSLGQ